MAETEDDSDFSWDISQESTSTPISTAEFNALSFTQRGWMPQHCTASLNLSDWFDGKKSQSSASSPSSSSSTNSTSTSTISEPSSLGDTADYQEVKSFLSGRSRNQHVNDREYVEQYMKDVENMIYKVSRNQVASIKGPVRNIPGQRTMWTDEDPVYASFDMDAQNANTSALAIFRHKNEILEGLHEHQVLIIEGFTGSGKTTQVPQYILDDFASRGKLGNIMVTQPRRIAAQSIADRVCKERRWNMGDLVGFQVGLNKRASVRTRLTYVTTGVLLQTLISKKSLRDYTHIIVDEVHERDLDTDLLLLVIKKLLLETADITTKIILMSATMNADKFGDYFPRWLLDSGRLNSKIIRVPQTKFYRVYEHYIDTLNETFVAGLDVPQNDILQDVGKEAVIQTIMYEFTVKLLVALDQFEKNVDSSDTERGGVLVFLPGLLEIDTMFKKCMDYLERKVGENTVDLVKWTLLPLHSSITTEEQQKVFLPSQPGYRKIILSTNIAESSITVTDIKYVIDFCLTKSMSCDPQTNYSCLRLDWASQDQCVQRRGRVGRVSEGHVFRIITKTAYSLLQKETIPEMEKASLESVILSVKTLDLGPPVSVIALAIDPPGLSTIKLAICNLKEVGALTITANGTYNPHDGDMTMMGILMSKLPFDIRISRLIALGNVFGVLEEAVMIATGLSVKSPFSVPFTQRLMAYLSKLMWSNEAFSDCFAIINVFKTWMRKQACGELRTYDQLRKWKRAYFVQTNALREMHLSVQDVMKRLQDCDIRLDLDKMANSEMSAEQGLILKVVIAGAFYPNYFVRFRPEPTDYARQISRELNALDPLMTIFYTGFPSEQPGELYATHIAKKFESINSAPYIKVHGTKVLVHFDPRGDKIGSLSINLFKGIKMKQLHENIGFGGIRSDRAHEICTEEKILAKNRVFESPKQCVLPGITDSEVLVSVTKMLSPDNFWVMYQNELSIFNELTVTIKDAISGCKTIPTENDIVAGSLCIVLHDSVYFRARVEYITTDGMNMMLFLIDIGDVVWREPKECFMLSQELIDLNVHKIPAMGIKCRIYGIKALESYAGCWCEEACTFFAEVLTMNNNVVVLDVYSVVESVVAGNIYGRHFDGSGKDSGVRKMLLSNGLAKVTEESKSSRDNHNLRRHATNTGFSEMEIDRINKLQRSDTSPPILLRPPTEVNCTQEFILKGPNSPLEIKFRALSASTHTKAVMVDPCSVNSVALDENPSTPTSIVIVAAGVGISQKTGSVLLRETTLLPPIPGLASLLTMIFCPTMQLRLDPEYGRYTGCLSGLGKDYATNFPVYPDHDMEIVFDTLIDDKDIHMINGLRVIMDLVLSGEHATKFTIEDMRKTARDEIKGLLERPRKPVEQIYPRQQFVWRDDPKENPANKAQQKYGVRRMAFKLRRTDIFPVHSVEVFHRKTRNFLPESLRDAIHDREEDFLRS